MSEAQVLPATGGVRFIDSRALTELSTFPAVLAVLALPAGQDLRDAAAALAKAIEEVVAGSVPAVQAAPGPRRSLAPVREWMLAHLAEPMRLDDLARLAFLSRRQFTRDFRAEMGVSPLKWLMERRLDEAERLLETTDLPVDRIAEEAGFPTPAALRLHFKRRTNLTPSAYREYRRTSEAAAAEPTAA